MPKHYNYLLFHVKKKKKKEGGVIFHKFEICNEIMYFFLLNFMKYKINMPKYMNRDIKNCLICFPETKHEDNVRHKLNGSFYTDI